MAVLTYKNACIMYLEQNMECVSYRDYIINQLNKLEQIEQILDAWNNDASHSFRDMCNINEILKG